LARQAGSLAGPFPCRSGRVRCHRARTHGKARRALGAADRDREQARRWRHHRDCRDAESPGRSASTQAKQGKLKALAIASPKRSAALPDVPTMAELGYPGFEATLWLGAFAPAGTPQAAVNRISADIGTVLKNPEVRARLEGLGGEVVGMPQEVFAKLYARDLERWGKSIRDLNIRID
jgi:hypothetical protein